MWVPNLGSFWRRPVEELELAELVEHYGYAPREGLLTDVFTEGERDPEARIPTLAEFGDWAASSGLRMLLLDVKLAADQTELAEKIARSVDASMSDAGYSIFLMSPHEAIVVTMRDWFAGHRPQSAVRFIVDHETEGALNATRRLDLDAISTGKTVLRSWSGYLEEIEYIVEHRARRAPIIDPVVSWTIDDVDRMRVLVEAGVDGIITNEPAELARIAAED